MSAKLDFTLVNGLMKRVSNFFTLTNEQKKLLPSKGEEEKIENQVQTFCWGCLVFLVLLAVLFFIGIVCAGILLGGC